MSLITDFKKKIPLLVKDKQVFLYESEQFDAVAFIDGLKNKNVNFLKLTLKDFGFLYDYTMKCYVNYKTKNKETFRREKNKFIDNFISWKFDGVLSDKLE